MSAIGLSAPPATIRWMIPTRQEIRAAMTSSPNIVIAAITAVTVVVLALIAGVVLLAFNDKSTEALTLVIAGPLVAALVAMMGRLRSIESKVDAATTTTLDSHGTP